MKKVKFVTYLLQQAHKLYWCLKIKAFSTCVNGGIRHCRVGALWEIINFTFCRECHVLLLKVFDRANVLFLALAFRVTKSTLKGNSMVKCVSKVSGHVQVTGTQHVTLVEETLCINSGILAEK